MSEEGIVHAPAAMRGVPNVVYDHAHGAAFEQSVDFYLNSSLDEWNCHSLQLGVIDGMGQFIEIQSYD